MCSSYVSKNISIGGAQVPTLIIFETVKLKYEKVKWKTNDRDLVILLHIQMIKCNVRETDTCTLHHVLIKFHNIVTLVSVSTFAYFFLQQNICVNDLETLLHGNFDFLDNFCLIHFTISQTFLQQFCRRQPLILLYKGNFFLRY